ncbi:hypothetical protein ALC57_04160 [Trachymyrmex cornetzi]|uniref:Uncharacterized protein n=1 Tax=Trachymyrmex cornetzi TaxID=471704 RepID=A0A195EER0_9HYME|nr:hypothetical protein ALC57_04160 [Trachymyrmex cornetzi]
MYDARYSRLGEGMAAPRWSPAPRRGRKRGAACGGGKKQTLSRARPAADGMDDDGRAAGDNDGDKARLADGRSERNNSGGDGKRQKKGVCKEKRENNANGRKRGENGRASAMEEERGRRTGSRYTKRETYLRTVNRSPGYSGFSAR